MKKFSQILAEFRGKNILIVGDVMIDHYLHGTVSRHSPEAPVPVLLAEKDEYRLGGAANVAHNIVKLGGNPLLVSMCGADDKGENLIRLLNESGISHEGLVRSKDYPTTEKLRVVDKLNKQLIRLDFERADDITGLLEDSLISKFDKYFKDASAVIISDYAKGVMSPQFIRYVIERSQSKPVFIDPKPKHKEFYKNAFLLTPNEKEAAEMSGIDEVNDGNCDEIGKRLTIELNANVVITRGKKGMKAYMKDDGNFEVPTKAEEVFDVTGAGDTVISTIALAYASGADVLDACQIANLAAHVVIGKFGTETSTIEEISKLL